MATSNELIQLIIRTANNNYPDFDLEISSLLTVYELKQNITINHPTKPIPKDQRLIYSGKLLDDKTQLNQIFLKSSSGSSFMIHLVLDSDKNATMTKSTSIKTEETNSTVSQENLTNFSPYEKYFEELNKYQQVLLNQSNNTFSSNSQTQIYLEYCQTHYQMFQNLISHQRTTIQPTIQINNSTTTTTNVTPPPAPPAGNNNNEVEQENDLLGVLNMLVELFVLCSIIYFYSTFSRFLVVFVIFVLLYLHCRGYLSIQRRRRAQVRPQPVAEQQGEDEAEPEQTPNPNDLQRPPTSPTEENPITTTRLLFTAVSTFFSSLIPERPQRT